MAGILKCDQVQSDSNLSFQVAGANVAYMNASGMVYGNTTIGASTITTSGIVFPSTQITSSDPNTLDDYEEGTWTPVLTRSSGGTTVTYGAQAGKYVKIGRMVHIQGVIYITAVGAQGTGICIVSGLPFNFDTSYNQYINSGLSVTYNTVFATNVVKSCWCYLAGLAFLPNTQSTSEISDNYQVGYLTFAGSYYIS